MAYDEQRTFWAGPPLHAAVHDQRRLFGTEQSVGHNHPSSLLPGGGGVVSSRAYATGPIHMAGPSRRPLPTPRSRPESMPPPPRQFPLVVQAPAPSRPAILASLAPSPTVPPARRPLPTPALTWSRPATKHASVDLTCRPTSPVKSSINADTDHDLRIPSSFSRRPTLLPDANPRPPPLPTAPFSTPSPTWPRSPHSDAHETQQVEYAPLWNRNLPATSSAQFGANVIERRSTVSGVLPPTIFPSAVPPPRPDLRRSVSPERTHPAQQLQFSPPRRPLPSSPTEPPRVPSLHQRVPASPQDEREPSSPSDGSAHANVDSYEPMTFADPTQLEGEHDIDIVLAKNARTPSPQYGIRDLPTRSRIAIANRDGGQNANATVPETQREHVSRPLPATLPQPPASHSSISPAQPQAASLPQSPRARMSPPVPGTFASFSNRSRVGTPSAEPQSLTLRLASMCLAEEREQRQTQGEVSSPSPAQSPVRAIPSPVSPVRQQQGWLANIPPLPRTPGSSTRPVFGTTAVLAAEVQSSKANGISSSSPTSVPTSPTRPFSSSPNPNATFDRKSFAQQSPRPPPNLQSHQGAQLSERQLQKQRVRDSDIDLDDAPPPSLRRSPSPIRQAFAQAPAIEITNDTPPRRQWTPSRDVTSNSYPGFRAASQSPERRGQPLTRPLIQSPAQSQRTAAPRILLSEDDSDNDTPGPGIVVSGPKSSPSISVSTSGTPSISGGPSVAIAEHGAPAISVSAADPPSISFSPPKISVSNSAQSQKSSGGFGSRHTQIQESSSPSRSMPGRGPACKRGLPSPPSNPVRTNGLSCGGCNGPIVGRIVSAMGQRWHPNCFRCSICNELLEHVSSYEHDGKPYCHLDYHESFAPRCFHCKTAIIDERFITLDDPALGKRTYHEQHFFCAECGDPFLAPSGALPPSVARTGELNLTGDGEFVDDDVGFTVYRGHPYCEACHVRLRMPKCKACKKSIRDGVRAVEALGGKWCWGCFVCDGCKKPFEDPSFFLRNEKPFCEPCFSLMLRNEV